MSGVKFVEHTGYVEEISSGQAKVRILSESACASCHAKGACTAADMKEKVIDVYTNNIKGVEIGKQVVIQGQKSLGLKASMIAYIIPFVLVIITLFLTFAITQDESISGITSLVILVPYFLLVKLYTPKLKKTFVFTIKNIID